MGTEKGQSLIEVIIAATVGILVVSALTFTTIFSLRNANFAKTSSQATKLAQEGIERVKTGRDRNKAINSNGQLIGVAYWNGNERGVGAIWDYLINGNCGNTTLTPPTFCYFKVDTDGNLEYLNSGNNDFYPSNTEEIGQFKRRIILSDEAANNLYKTQKKVTIIVTWTDFIGSHESKLVTILGKI